MGRLSVTDREEIVRRYHQGEKGTALAIEFHTTRQNITFVAGARQRQGTHRLNGPQRQRTWQRPGPRSLAWECTPPEHRTPEAISKRQAENARQDAAKAAHEEAMRVIMANPQPSGERCVSKGCAFPAIFGVHCRKHFLDSHAERSIVGCQAMVSISQAHLLYIGG